MVSPTPIPPLPSSPAALSAEALAKEEVPPGGKKEDPQIISPPPVPHPSKRPWLLVGLGILAAGILVGSFGTQILNPSKDTSSLAPSPSQKEASRFSQLASPTPTLAIGADIFADWKSYTNTAYRYSVKYPNDWKATSFGPGAGTVLLDNIQRGLLLAPAPLPPAEGMGMPLEDISIRLEASSAQTSGMTYDAWVNDVKKNHASTTISISETTLASTKTIVIQKNFSAVYLLPSPDKSLFYSIEVRSSTPDYRDTLAQILSTFKFTDQTSNTSDWVTFQIGGTPYSIKYPPNVQKTGAGDFDIFIVNGKELRYRFLGNKSNETLEKYISTFFSSSTLEVVTQEKISIGQLTGYKMKATNKVETFYYYFLQDLRAKSFMQFNYAAMDVSTETLFNQIIQTSSYQP